MKVIKLVNKSLVERNEKTISNKLNEKQDENKSYISNNNNKSHISYKSFFKDIPPKFSFSEVIAIDTIRLIFKQKKLTIKEITKELRYKNARI